MKRKNTKVVEIILVIALALFIIFACITYKNLSVLSEGLNQNAAEVTTETTSEQQ